MPLDLEKRFGRVSLGFFPSPVHKLNRLSRELGIEVWAKRDDVSSGLAFGGNKIRKLEWLAADALARGCDTLVSIGNIQSNHTRQVAAVAAVLGLKCRLVQEEWTRWDDPIYARVGNILLSRLMGAETVLEGEGYSTAVKDTWERALEQVRRDGGSRTRFRLGRRTIRLAGLAMRISLMKSRCRNSSSACSSIRLSPRRVPGRRRGAWLLGSVRRIGRAG